MEKQEAAPEDRAAVGILKSMEGLNSIENLSFDIVSNGEIFTKNKKKILRGSSFHGYPHRI